MPEAQLKDSGSGLASATEGWFVVNVGFGVRRNITLYFPAHP